MNYAPFAKQISPPGEKVIIVSLTNLAWGAYDEQGTLVRWDLHRVHAAIVLTFIAVVIRPQEASPFIEN